MNSPGPEELVELRRHLHREAELSSQEGKTAEIIDSFLKRCQPDESLRGLGGHGAAYIFRGHRPGPTVLLRCDLDALPIPESLDELDYGSKNPGVSHKCGHDGHMAMIAGVAQHLARKRPKRGRAVLLFQPAEETGDGAARVLADDRFQAIAPDFALALHNLPGRPLAEVTVRQGTFNCASVGLVMHLRGETSHAAEPEAARSPAVAVSRLLAELPQLPQSLGDGALLTLTHAALGEPTLGITPGHATLMATLRAASDETLDALVRASEARVHEVAAASQLDLSIERREPFRAVRNDSALAETVATAARELKLGVEVLDQPLRWSEDFAEFSARYPSVLFGLGAGLDQPPLHSPAYDFPDALIATGVRLWCHLLDELL